MTTSVNPSEVAGRSAPLRQDPHSTREEREKVLEVAIGREVRAFRRQKGITVADLAELTRLSIGMLSKIENGNTSPSLTTLQALSRALSVPLTAFFRGFEEHREAVHTPAGTGIETEREGTRAGHQYNLLGHIGSNASGVMVEPYLITLTLESDIFPTFQHGGIETIYVLEGELQYRHNDSLYHLNPATRCFSMQMHRTGRRFLKSSRPATCRSSPIRKTPDISRLQWRFAVQIRPDAGRGW